MRPGQRLTLQYGLDHYFTSRLLVGAEGGYNWQVTDDSGSAVYWDRSVHDQKAYIGGSIGCWLKPDKLLLNLKYNYEYAAQQRFAFQGVSLNLTYNTGKLTGRK